MHDARPDVTVIVTTYNRPDALRVALRSVLLQRWSRWAAIVVGDACDARTREAMEEFLPDPRFLFVNLPERCGEQALPNSAAMAVAATEYIALLNHDDLWLPDHLERALRTLQRSQADLYISRATAVIAQQDDRGSLLPCFTRTTPRERRWQDAFGDVFDVFEPASAWVFRRALAARVGPWRAALTHYRVPLQDWLLRAWRCGARLETDPWVTCLKVETHWQSSPGQPNYATGAALNAALLERMETLGEVFRNDAGDIAGLALEQPFARHHTLLRKEGAAARRAERLLRAPWVAALYRRSGFDAHALCSRVLGIPRGSLLRWSLRQRTGEMLAPPPALPSIVAHIRQARTAYPAWPGWQVEA